MGLQRGAVTHRQPRTDVEGSLDQPVDLGDLADFLTWAATTFSFSPPDPSTWPEPFSGLATVDVTIDKLCIDQVAGSETGGRVS